MKYKGKKKEKSKIAPQKAQLPEIKFKNADKIEYNIIWRSPSRYWQASGLCDDPQSKDPIILIDPDLDEKRLMEVLIEEVFHAYCFEKSERVARKFSADIRRMLYKIGFSR